MNDRNSYTMQCPLPLSEYPHILLAHGGGGRLMHQLIEKIFAVAFFSPDLQIEHDGAILDTSGKKTAFTTDSYVVDPLFFPGGDIGSLAINGTVNDLAMCGARPRYISAGFILEEGLPVGDLWRIAQSMRQAADRADVRIVTGDTKVVDRGKGHGVFITTAGIGIIEHTLEINPRRIEPGDAIILSGDIGRHGMAIMATREGLSFQTPIESDCAPLVTPVMRLIENGLSIHCLRDLTRGGLATTLVEIAGVSGLGCTIDERLIPVSEPVRGVCEVLGFDPLYVANEGRFIVILPESEADTALGILKMCDPDLASCVLGSVRGPSQGQVVLKTAIGTERMLDMLSGEQLPRIC